jgi:glycosyltransferase involved in cell wall biosynthesis
LRYFVGLRALPWAISTVLLRLSQSPGQTLRALLAKAGLNLRSESTSANFPAKATAPTWLAPVKPVKSSVLHLVTNSLPFTQAGYTIRTHNILEAQNRAGISATAVTRYGYPVNIGKFFTGNTSQIPAFNSKQQITYHHLIPTRLAAKNEMDEAVKGVLKLVENIRPEILHPATDFINGEIAAAVAAVTNLPFAYEVRGFLEQSWLTKSKANQVESEFYREFLARETAIMHQAQAITTLSLTMKNEIIKRGVDASKIFITPNAVSENLLTNIVEPATARANLGLAELPTFGIATTLYPFENVGLLISVFDQLHKAGNRVQLVIVGDGPELPNLQQQAARSENQKHIHLVGRKPFAETINYYQAIDVFCVPRTNSAVTQLVTPLKPLEAMALGRTVIASDLPALAELIEHDRTGVLVQPDSLSALTEALGQLLYDSAYQQRLADAAKEWVAATRTWSNVAAQYNEVYQQLGKR